jgi:hypothetical protein
MHWPMGKTKVKATHAVGYRDEMNSFALMVNRNSSVPCEWQIC